jgi:hypothetical protein
MVRLRGATVIHSSPTLALRPPRGLYDQQIADQTDEFGGNA